MEAVGFSGEALHPPKAVKRRRDVSRLELLFASKERDVPPGVKTKDLNAEREEAGTEVPEVEVEAEKVAAAAVSIEEKEAGVRVDCQPEQARTYLSLPESLSLSMPTQKRK